MNGRAAAFVLLGVCAALAVLLLFGAISALTGGGLFAIALAILGGFSKGFQRKSAVK